MSRKRRLEKSLRSPQRAMRQLRNRHGRLLKQAICASDHAGARCPLLAEYARRIGAR